jgi:hypothetical protein
MGKSFKNAMLLRKVILCLLFLFSIAIFSQNSSDILVKVVDEDNQLYISFVTVKVKGSNNGLIADYYGEFRLPDGEEMQSKTLILSSIGYQTKEVVVSELSKKELNIIYLKPQFELLDTVVLEYKKTRTSPTKSILEKNKKKSAYDIVFEAISRIPKHLSSTSHSYIGYYRDYQLIRGEYYNLNEGIIETFDEGVTTNYLSDDYGHTAVYKFSENDNFKKDEAFASTYDDDNKFIEGANILSRGGNEFRILMAHNSIRSYNQRTFSFVYELEREFIENHRFKKEAITYLDDESIAVISFKRKMDVHSKSNRFNLSATHEAEGLIHISLRDFAIHKFNYRVLQPRSDKELYNVTIEYKRQMGQMYLNYITFNNTFKVSDDFILKELEVVYLADKHAFRIKFSRPPHQLLPETLLSRNFKLKYDNRRLRITKIDNTGKHYVLVYLDPSDKALWESNADEFPDPKLFDVSLKRIKDLFGYEIYEIKSLGVNQFREFFVQRVNTNQPLPKDLDFMDLNKPIIKSDINNQTLADDFWINTPLKTYTTE